MALALYYGKENGYEERDALLAHLRELDDRTYTVLGCEWMNRKNDPAAADFHLEGVTNYALVPEMRRGIRRECS